MISQKQALNAVTSPAATAKVRDLRKGLEEAGFSIVNVRPPANVNCWLMDRTMNDSGSVVTRRVAVLDDKKQNIRHDAHALGCVVQILEKVNNSGSFTVIGEVTVNELNPGAFVDSL